MSKRKAPPIDLFSVLGKPPKKPKREDLDTEHWTHYPTLVDPALFTKLLAEVKPLVAENSGKAPYTGATFTASRLSCRFGDEKKESDQVSGSRAFSYGQLPWFAWSDSPTILIIRAQLQAKFNMVFDYLLVHLYVNGNSNIGFHSDSEASRSCVASVSLGATRRFLFRRQGVTSGVESELSLESGDCVLMKASCQHALLHSVPVEKRVKGERLNLTFRQFQ
jgi:alkylated DNA repair dioxygenase AlkB